MVLVASVAVAENLATEIESDERHRSWSGFVLGYDGSAPSDGAMPGMRTCFLMNVDALHLNIPGKCPVERQTAYRSPLHGKDARLKPGAPFLDRKSLVEWWTAMEVGMTKEDMAQKLDHMDPGATLTVPENVLARIFGEVTLSYDSQEALRHIADFALEHRCTFSFHEHEGAVPCFRKDDIF